MEAIEQKETERNVWDRTMVPTYPQELNDQKELYEIKSRKEA